MKLTELLVIKEQRVPQQMRATKNVLRHIFFLGRKLLKRAISSRIFHEMSQLLSFFDFTSESDAQQTAVREFLIVTNGKSQMSEKCLL
jgi:hypothetical protein